MLLRVERYAYINTGAPTFTAGIPLGSICYDTSGTSGPYSLTTEGWIALGNDDATIGLINGIVKGDGAGVTSAAIAGTDYLLPTGNGSGLTGLTFLQLSGVPDFVTETALEAVLTGPSSDPSFNATNWRSDLSLANVENTALSTWPGSANLTTLGTVATGTWHGTSIDNAYLSTGIDATKIADGSVSNAEFQRLDATSSIQTQLDARALTSHNHDGSAITTGTVSASRLPSNIPATLLADGSVTNTELQYLSTVTSNVQNQLNALVAGGVQDATESQKGIAEIATSADIITGTDDTRIVTPLKLSESKQATINWPLTADNQTVTVGNYRYIRLQPNSTTATDRTFLLAAGYTGQIVTLAVDSSSGSNKCELTRSVFGGVALNGTWTARAGNWITLQFNESNWVELGRSEGPSDYTGGLSFDSVIGIFNAGTYQTVKRHNLLFGTLPNTATKNVAHGLTFTNIIHLHGVANNGTSWFAIAQPSLALSATATNVSITATANWSAYTGYITIEYY